METTTPEKAEKIEVGSKRMREAWEQGLDWYQPTLGGHELREEGGVTQVSLENLDVLVEQIGRPTRVSVGPNQGVLVEWSPLSECYLATGFSIGYGGTGPMGLAKFLAAQNFGDLDRLRTLISGLSPHRSWVFCPREDGE